MNRNDYLNKCRQYHISGKTTVTYQKANYYPQGYELKFDGTGNAIHTALLIDVGSNSLVYALLDRIDDIKKGGAE